MGRNGIALWSSPIVFVIYLREEEVAQLDAFLQLPENSILCDPRIRLLTYVAAKGSFFYSNYPINILRNLGIHNVHTSHMIVLDMDMWLSSGDWECSLILEDSYETLLRLPDDIKNDKRAALVIPAFFHTGWQIKNGTLMAQVNSLGWGGDI